MLFRSCCSWPLRVRPDGQAWDTENGRLLLDPAGVGHDDRGAADERDEVEIAERLDDLHAAGFRYDRHQVEAAERRSGPFKGCAEYVFRR